MRAIMKLGLRVFILLPVEVPEIAVARCRIGVIGPEDVLIDCQSAEEERLGSFVTTLVIIHAPRLFKARAVLG